MPAPGGLCPRCQGGTSEGDRFCARCGASLASGSKAPDADPLIGRRIGSGYTLQELIGVGGMGRVYRAEQDALGRTVAVKVIHPHLLGDDTIVARFYREARATSRLNHPHSVGVIDFGRTDDGILYLVMEFLPGRELADVMVDEGPLALPRIGRILDGVLRALAEAHELGIVHRDLKPENILLKPDRDGGELVKVVDFGLATILTKDDSTSITLTGTVCGTPEYMSPEQVRGDSLDGRSDLYALGIILYELLTDEVPFTDETPAKTILRHLDDPVPDPRQVAPSRGIPDALADVVIRALAKRAEDRFPDAPSMRQALTEALTVDEPEPTIRCPACATPAAASTRFCGACGARLPASIPPQHHRPIPSAAPRMSSYPPALGSSSLVGRANEMSELDDARRTCGTSALWIHIEGEAGVGKTRLMTEVAARAAEEGDLVVGATPHPSRAPVAYAPIRHVVRRLLDAGEGPLAEQELGDVDALSHAGLEELDHPVGIEGFDSRARIGAVAASLTLAVERAQRRSPTGKVVLLVDDLQSCDGLSPRVLARFADSASPGVLLLTASQPGETMAARAKLLPLLGLDANATSQFFAASPDASDGRRATLVSSRFMLPLYLAQLKAVGGANGGQGAPPRLADAVAQRLEGLPVETIRVLQALAVLGDRAPQHWVAELVPFDAVPAIGQLVAEGLVRRRYGHTVEIEHPFIRDLVESSIPAEARHALHARALEMLTEDSAPLEVRAEHAWGGGDPVGALFLLERMGDLALRRGDAQASVLAFRRALEVARRELLETGDAFLESGIVSFSRKLGQALAQTGDLAGAEGVLRESLDLTDRRGADRVKSLVVLSTVLLGRQRTRQSERMLKQALGIAQAREEPGLEAEVLEWLGRLQRITGDLSAAAESLRRAHDLWPDSVSPAVPLRTGLALAEVLAEIGQRREAATRAEQVLATATEQGTLGWVAAATACLARIAELDGLGEDAATRYREAADVALRAGDADGADRWQRSALRAAA